MSRHWTEPVSGDDRVISPLLASPATQQRVVHPVGAPWPVIGAANDCTAVLPFQVWGIWSKRVVAAPHSPGRPRSPPCLLIASRPQDWPGCGARPSSDLGP